MGQSFADKNIRDALKRILIWRRWWNQKYKSEAETFFFWLTIILFKFLINFEKEHEKRSDTNSGSETELNQKYNGGISIFV